MIEIRDIEKTYRSGDTEVRALRGITTTIGDGEFTAIAGPSGSGKSTLLNVLGCLDTPDRGTLAIDGENLLDADARARADFRRRNLGFVFQTFNLIPVLTAYENVALTLSLLGLAEREIRKRTNEILAEVGLAGMEDRRPSRLSGGQQQRVAIARALAKRPRLVLADEPTANLDSETGESVLELMRTLNETHGSTFVFSTHDPMVMRYSRRLLRLTDGRVTEDRS